MRKNLPLFQGHDGRTLVLEDSFIRVDANVELTTELAGLDNGTGVTCLGQKHGMRFSRDTEYTPWWKKSKQPSIQMRSSRMAGAGSPGGDLGSTEDMVCEGGLRCEQTYSTQLIMFCVS